MVLGWGAVGARREWKACTRLVVLFFLQYPPDLESIAQSDSRQVLLVVVVTTSAEVAVGSVLCQTDALNSLVTFFSV